MNGDRIKILKKRIGEARIFWRETREERLRVKKELLSMTVEMLKRNPEYKSLLKAQRKYAKYIRHNEKKLNKKISRTWKSE